MNSNKKTKMMNKTSRMRWTIGLILAAAIIVAGVSTAIGSGPPSTSTPPAAPASLPNLPSGALSANFGALRAPATAPAAVSPAVRAQFNASPVVEKFGLDLGAVHTVGAPGHTFYAAPGERALCLFLDDGGSVCSNNLGALKRNGLSFSVVPPAPGRVSPDMNTVGPGTINTYGIAPDGVVSIDGLTSDGRDVPAEMSNGGYVITTTSPVTTMSFHSANATWQTAPGGANG